MDQEQASEALNPSASISPKKLNAKAPEFVPRSSGSSAAAPPPPPPLLRPVYVRPPPPSFVPPLPPPYYGYENYYQQNVAPFYGYNVNPVGPVEFVADVKNGGTTTVTTKNGLPDAHQKIINQVEFYFSDINLATTDQLFRFMSKDPEGYVPLPVVASFKKIKTAITDVAQLASVLRGSNKLLVSEDGEKVKRKHPLTESDMEELQSRIVIAENLPEDHSHQNLMKIFSSVGSVKSIRTCPPQNQNGSSLSASKPGKGDGLHFSGKFHAFVEYESVEVAEKAVTELKDEASWRYSLKVRSLLKSAVKSTHTRTKKVGHEGQTSGKRDEAAVSEMQGFKENQSEDSPRQSDAKNHERQLDDNAKGNVQRKGRNGNNKGKGRGQGRGRPHHPPTNGGSVLGSAPLEVSTEKLNLAKAAASPVPRMPDGTKGFSVGRGKSVAV
ncbi:la-related protein 6b [Phtheirospermum japonicum]|uniref:La-related protein 6b n=1 Tax=Phtheirospermum japonicum TaxID=374723 RepID=A0A830BQ96_9LAMI|nr:la-related protein 6b [Phtheirospermum japonicum]